MAKKTKNPIRHPLPQATQTQRTVREAPASLPLVGRGRWNDIAPFVGVSRETWRRLVSEGRAPAAQRISERCTLYDFASVHAWISNPANFVVKEAQ